MVEWIIWAIVCFYTVVLAMMLVRDLVKGEFDIVRSASKSGRIIMRAVIILIFTVILIITFLNMPAKMHLLWLVPLGLLIGIIAGSCIIQAMIKKNMKQ